MNDVLKKTFNFGKITYYSKRKINDVIVEIELKYSEDKQVFTASGSIWNSKHTDILSGGQNLHEISKYVKNPTFIKIYRLWKLYHLNDMHAGTVKQEEFLNQHFKDRYHSYEESIEVLQKVNLLIDDGYRYGSSWLYRPIPKNDLEEIKELLTK